MKILPELKEIKLKEVRGGFWETLRHWICIFYNVTVIAVNDKNLSFKQRIKRLRIGYSMRWRALILSLNLNNIKLKEIPQDVIKSVILNGDKSPFQIKSFSMLFYNSNARIINSEPTITKKISEILQNSKRLSMLYFSGKIQN